jgi:Uma2 family endonuclease
LLDGQLVDMSPEGEPHWRVINRLIVRFASRPELLRVSAPFPVADGWMPQPDVALAPMDQNDLTKRPDHAYLAVEVAISSLAHDRYKAGVYARASIPRYWLVDVNAGVVIEHTQPGPAGYAQVVELRGDDVLDARVDGVPTSTVAELLRGTGRRA